MPEEGLEPSSLAGHDFESCVYTIPPLRQFKHSIAKRLHGQTIYSILWAGKIPQKEVSKLDQVKLKAIILCVRAGTVRPDDAATIICVENSWPDQKMVQEVMDMQVLEGAMRRISECQGKQEKKRKLAHA